MSPPWCCYFPVVWGFLLIILSCCNVSTQPFPDQNELQRIQDKKDDQGALPDSERNSQSGTVRGESFPNLIPYYENDIMWKLWSEVCATSAAYACHLYRKQVYAWVTSPPPIESAPEESHNDSPYPLMEEGLRRRVPWSQRPGGSSELGTNSIPVTLSSVGVYSIIRLI